MKLKLLLNRYFWFDLKYKIKCFFYPKQKWLTDVIPNTFCDKVELIPNLLFACLVDYIEVEKKQNFIRDVGYDWAEELKDGFVTQTYVDAVNLREEELSWACRCRKPTFIVIEGGKKKTPFWVMGMFPHKYIYNNFKEVEEQLIGINSGKIPISSDRWKMFEMELR